jgi:SAM-dependent methyltransferase
MQNERTLQFWDAIYLAETDPKEWISRPSIALMDEFLAPNKQAKMMTSTIRVLEIGCGTSTLARDLYHHARQSGQPVYVCATDVSEVCIRQCQTRDAFWISQSDHDDNSTLEYRVLNVADPHPSMRQQFDLVVDKGCLDTFLFRSRQRGGNGQQPYGALVRAVLDHVHSWLVPTTGRYVVLTPRCKLKSLRDFRGFCSVQKRLLPSSDAGELDGKLKNRVEPAPSFLYTCLVNDEYEPSQFDNAFSGLEKKEPVDGETCTGCRISFGDFRRGESTFGRGTAFWFRQWSGHCQHCKG